MTRVIKRNSGGILLIDYGYDRDFDTFTLQSVIKHKNERSDDISYNEIEKKLLIFWKQKLDPLLPEMEGILRLNHLMME